MKKIVLLIVATAFCLAGHAQKTKNMEGTKTLVAYFSATGNTERVAKLIASATGGKLYRIQPREDYTRADLDWNDKSSRSSREMADAKSRPAIVENLEDIDSYDTVYIGYPIWWDMAPRVIDTFIETYDLTGKNVIPFATSGGSGIAGSERELRKTFPGLTWRQGKLLNRASEEEVVSWVEKNRP